MYNNKTFPLYEFFTNEKKNKKAKKTMPITF